MNFHEEGIVSYCRLWSTSISLINLLTGLKVNFSISLESYEDFTCGFLFSLSLHVLLSFPYGKQFLKCRKFHKSLNTVLVLVIKIYSLWNILGILDAGI